MGDLKIGWDAAVGGGPILVLCVGIMISLLGSVIHGLKNKPHVFYFLSLITFVAAGIMVMVSCAILGPAAQTFFAGGVLTGKFAFFGQSLILAIALIVLILMGDSYLKERFFMGEVQTIYLTSVVGMLTVVSTDDIITLFVGLELMSFSVYGLIGYLNASRVSQEGAIKYFILGSLASALLLFGFSLLFAATGTFYISEMLSVLPKVAIHAWTKVGALFVLIGLGFKFALVPFHLWTPDAYEAAPTGITAFMATAVKAAVLFAMIRFLCGGFITMYGVWLPEMTFFASLSILVGNFMALVQGQVKRMLAYSSIAHSGYMAIGLAAFYGTNTGMALSAVLFYLLIYVGVSLGTFAIIMWLENTTLNNLHIDDLSGLSQRHPWASLGLVLFMFSLGGLPPTAGFIAKFFVLTSAISSQLVGLVLIAMMGSTVALFYYLRLIVRMYMREPAGAATFSSKRKTLSLLITVGCLLFSLALGTILPGQVLHSMQDVASEIAGK